MLLCMFPNGQQIFDLLIAPGHGTLNIVHNLMLILGKRAALAARFSKSYIFGEFNC